MDPKKNKPENSKEKNEANNLPCPPLLFLALHRGKNSDQKMSPNTRNKLDKAKNELEEKPPETLPVMTKNKPAKNTSRSPSPLSMDTSK